MKPTEYLRLFSHQKNITELQNVLLNYIKENGDDIDQLKAISKDILSMIRINEYELELRIAEMALEQWK